MSYYPPPQGGYPPFQGQPPQQPYGQQYPPTQGYPPPQQGYGAPSPGGYQQPPPPAPYGQQPPYGQPPPGQYQQPPPGQYQQPPPGQYQQPPPGQYQQPPPGQYGYQQPPPGQYPPPSGSPYPPAHQGYQQPPPQQPFGAAPPGQYGIPPPGAFPPTPPTLGYVPNQQAPMDLSRDIEALYKAMKGFGTDEKTLINVLAKKDPLQINSIRLGFYQRYNKDLIKYLEKETSGYFEQGLVAIARGPLVADCWALRGAMKGAGTKEVVLDEVLVGRSNADINAIKHEYQSLFGRPLEADLKGDLSAATEQLFLMLVSARRAEDSAPVVPQQVDQDVVQLQNALGGSFITKDNIQVCQLLTSRNNAQLQAICRAYQSKFSKSLESVIKSRFSGHMEDVLVLLLARANNRALADAEGLEAAMAGLGTKDELLVQRVVRVHWDRNHLANVKREYQAKYRRDLVTRIKGETSGAYERLMVACVE